METNEDKTEIKSGSPAEAMQKVGRCSFVYADDESSYCIDPGWDIYCGFCPAHWAVLPAKQRAILLKERLALPSVTHHHVHKTVNETNQTDENHHHHQHINPPVPKLLTFVIGFVGAVAGYVVTALLQHWLVR